MTTEVVTGTFPAGLRVTQKEGLADGRACATDATLVVAALRDLRPARAAGSRGGTAGNRRTDGLGG